MPRYSRMITMSRMDVHLYYQQKELEQIAGAAAHPQP